MVQGSTLLTNVQSTMVFENNKCGNAGAGILGLGDNNYTILELNGSFQFRNNSSLNGGGLHFQNSRIVLGGQFLFEGSRNTFSFDCCISDEDDNQVTGRATLEEVHIF